MLLLPDILRVYRVRRYMKYHKHHKHVKTSCLKLDKAGVEGGTWYVEGTETILQTQPFRLNIPSATSVTVCTENHSL